MEYVYKGGNDVMNYNNAAFSQEEGSTFQQGGGVGKDKKQYSPELDLGKRKRFRLASLRISQGRSSPYDQLLSNYLNFQQTYLGQVCWKPPLPPQSHDCTLGAVQLGHIYGYLQNPPSHVTILYDIYDSKLAFTSIFGRTAYIQ